MYLSKCNIQGRIYLSNWLCLNVNIGKGVNYIVSYAVTMVIIYCAMDEDCLTFCFLRFIVRPVRLDSYCQAPPGRHEQSIARASHTDSKPIQHHPLPGTKTTSGSSQNGPMSGDCSDEDSAAYVDMKQHRHSFDSYSNGVSRSQAKRSS